MTTIRSLFDASRNIDRIIEKVITYGASQEARLKAEISEYVVTDSIEEQFGKVLDRMQWALETGGQNEVGIWVSGFYGSGKSSFTKYLGLAFDEHVTIDGTPFVKHLQDRLHKPQTKALLGAVTQRYPAAVVMLDLASEMVASATMEDVSTVLYYKVLQWAGYSRNLKVAAFERRVELDSRFDEFLGKIDAVMPGIPWKDLQNDPLIVDGLMPQIAYEMYPALFPTPASFSSNTEGFVTFENNRVEEMIDLVRRKSGKQQVIFIIDEVGQYIASRNNLILNLDGLAKNIKAIGESHVWIIATAQQTLTEDDPRAALNSPELYKLNDRFPIKVDLESKDIKEICYRRLLAKSPTGEKELGRLFDAYGQELRQNTKLQDAKYYDADFAKESFINLYPFLPAHFDILLHLLGALAKSTGGVGLRSAIKIVQDILVEQRLGVAPVADQPVGWLATTVTLFDALEKDIRRAFPSIYQAVGKARIRFPDSQLHEDICKSVAVLQILGNLPVTVQNVASLMHPSVTGPSRQEAVRQAVEEMLKDALVPLAEKDGNIRFLSEKLHDIEDERTRIPLRTVDVRRILNDALRETFDPLPRCSLEGTMTVTTGLKVRIGGSVTSLAGDQNPVQTVVEFVDPGEYEDERNRLLEDSRSRLSQNIIALIARGDSAPDELAGDIYRCKRIDELHRNDPDQEVKDYCISQQDRAAKLAAQLQKKVKQMLEAGSFIFRGQPTAVVALDSDLQQAAKKLLADVASQVFDRYSEAAERVPTETAERLLRAGVGNPGAISRTLDPLGLVETVGGVTKFKTDHKAVVSICDSIRQNGATEGKRVLDHFAEAPFGWQQDTTRYVVAVMLMAGIVKLKISGREVTAAGQQAIDALKTNNSFKLVGVSLRDDAPPLEVLGRASTRLSDLIGDRVVPMEQEISKAAVKHFLQLQRDYAPLAGRLRGLGLAGDERAQALCEEIATVLSTDASDVPQRLGSPKSVLYDNLTWAHGVKWALDNGLEETVRELQEYRHAIESLPDTGVPGELRGELAEDLTTLSELSKREDFPEHGPEFSTPLTHIAGCVRNAVVKLLTQQKSRLGRAVQELQRVPGWGDLIQEQQLNVASRLDALLVDVTQDLAGMQKLLAQDYNITNTIDELKSFVTAQGEERRRLRIQDEHSKDRVQEDGRLSRSIELPVKVTAVEDLEDLMGQLQDVRSQVGVSREFEVTFSIKKGE